MKKAFPLEHEIKDFINFKMNYIMFEERDFTEFVQVVAQTVVKKNERISLDKLISILEKHTLKPNHRRLENNQFYTLENSKLQDFSSVHKYVLIVGVVLCAIVLVSFAFFTLKCLCKTASFMLCCPCLFGKKKKNKEKNDITLVIVDKENKEEKERNK